MANFVVKKHGKKEPFDFEKIKKSIMACAQNVDLTEERRKEVVDQVSSAVLQMAGEREEVEVSQIRSKILQELDFAEPSVAEAWREYDKHKK